MAKLPEFTPHEFTLLVNSVETQIGVVVRAAKATKDPELRVVYEKRIAEMHALSSKIQGSLV